jgi:lipopolysaccharide transport system ATP-binding protein
MSMFAIQVEGLAKQYRIGEREPYRALRDVLARALRAPFRGWFGSSPQSSVLSPQSLAPSLRSPVSGRPPSHFWALKDVSFSVEPGEVVGIVGRNGAGKSTLLKILSRITKPTSGHATVYGRVGSLLEVGTGFHPELTGRENVYLNGAILGMKKAETARKFDEIVAFAEVEKFLDTPVKHYSSGMYVRLAFAVAAHLDPEILFVDEVLAVGDAAFQRKCLGKMDNVAKGGRTVVLVSHQLNQLRRLCTRSLWIDNGQVRAQGPTHTVIGAYETAMAATARDSDSRSGARHTKARFCGWEILEPRSPAPTQLATLGPVRIKFDLMVYERLRRASHGIALYNADRHLLWGTDTQELDFAPGRHAIIYSLSSLPLRPGAYQWLLSLRDQHDVVDLWEGVPELLVATAPLSHSLDDWAGVLNIPCKVDIELTDEERVEALGSL